MIRPVLKKMFSRERFEELTFFLRMGYWPDIRNPRSLNEHFCHAKIFERRFRDLELVDKLEVREVVERRLGRQVLTRVFATYDTVEEVRLSDLPQAFALKCNAGSGLNLVVENSNLWTDQKVQAVCRSWMEKPYSVISHSHEGLYDELRRRLFVEEFLGTAAGIQEYKFWCFGGEIAFVQVSRLSNGRRVYRLYDVNWVAMEFSIFHPPVPVVFERPAVLEQMCKYARALSEGHQFVRVDLNVSGCDRVTFGELTFRPGAGRVRFFPRSMDFELGERWRKS